MGFGRRSRKDAATDEFEYYEDTHNARGEYIGPVGSMPSGNMNFSMPMSGGSKQILVYYPKSPEDIMVLIEHLKKNNPAVVNLNNDALSPTSAQRIIDFLSGAIYALSGSVHTISANMFLLSPKGVDITILYDQK